MTIRPILLIHVFSHTCFRGSKVLMTLFALDLGASPIVAGLLFSTYSLLPAFVSVYAGRLADRVGPAVPMLVGICGMLAGLVIPIVVDGLLALALCAAVVGTCYIFYNVSVQGLIGTLGEGIDRTRNYSLFAMVVGITALLGPLVAGFSFEHLGGPGAYVVMTALTTIPALVLTVTARRLPRGSGSKASGTGSGAMGLLRHPPLRHMLIVSGIIETGNELGNFLLPVYGTKIGLSPSEIGIVMAALAVALLSVRALIPVLVKRLGEPMLLAASMAVAAIACLVAPLADSFATLSMAAFVMGAGIGCGAPLGMTLVYNRSPPGRTSEAIGLRQTVNKSTEVAVPVVFGGATTASAALGMIPIFWGVAALMMVGAMMMRHDAQRERASASVEDSNT